MNFNIQSCFHKKSILIVISVLCVCAAVYGASVPHKTHASAHPISVQEEDAALFESIKNVDVAESSEDVFFVREDGGVVWLNPAMDNYVSGGGAPISNTRSWPAKVLSYPSGEQFATIDTLRDGTTRLSLHNTAAFRESARTSAYEPESVYTASISTLDTGTQNVFASEEVVFISRSNVDNSDRKVAVVNVSEGSESFIDLQTSVISDMRGSPSEGRVFIATRDPNEIAVVGASGSVQQRIPLQSAPNKLVYDRDRGLLYVSHAEAGSVTRINIRNGETNEVTVEAQPKHMSLDAENDRLFVANNGPGSISVIQNGRVAEQYPLEDPAYTRSGAIDIAYLASTNTLIAYNPSSSRLYQIDLSTNNLRETPVTDSSARGLISGGADAYTLLNRGSTNYLSFVTATDIYEVPSSTPSNQAILNQPHVIVVDQSSGQFYVANKGAGNISVFNREYEHINTIEVSGIPEVMYLNQASSKLYVSDPSTDSIIRLRLSDTSERKRIQLPDGSQPRTIFANESTNTLYVSLSGNGAIGVLDGGQDSLEKVVSLPEAQFPLINSVDEENQNAYVADYGGNQLYKIDGETLTAESQTVVGDQPLWVRYINDHDLVYVTVEGENEIVALDPDSLDIVKRVQTETPPYRLLYDDEQQYLYVVHRDTKRMTILHQEEEDSFSVLTKKDINFIGELDTVFNMINEDLEEGRFYLSRTKGNKLYVTNKERDDEGVWEPVQIAEIVNDGRSFTQRWLIPREGKDFSTSSESRADEQLTFIDIVRQYASTIAIAVIVLVGITVLALRYWTRSTAREHS